MKVVTTKDLKNFPEELLARLNEEPNKPPTSIVDVLGKEKGIEYITRFCIPIPMPV